MVSASRAQLRHKSLRRSSQVCFGHRRACHRSPAPLPRMAPELRCHRPHQPSLLRAFLLRLSRARRRPEVNPSRTPLHPRRGHRPIICFRANSSPPSASTQSHRPLAWIRLLQLRLLPSAHVAPELPLRVAPYRPSPFVPLHWRSLARGHLHRSLHWWPACRSPRTARLELRPSPHDDPRRRNSVRPRNRRRGWSHTPSHALLWITISIAGLSAAAPVGWSIPSLIAPPSSVGRVGGILNLSNQLSGIAAPIVTGYLVYARHSFTAAFAVAGVYLAIGICAYLFLLRSIEGIDAG